jgi:hypothetical protein
VESRERDLLTVEESSIYNPGEERVKKPNRAIYNLTEGPIILPFKNLTLAGQGFRSFRTLSFLIGKEKIWTYTVGGL